VYGQNDGGGFGVAGRITKPGQAAVLADAGATGSIGLWVQSSTGIGAAVVGGFDDPDTGLFQPALSIIGTAGDLIDACPFITGNECDGNPSSVFTVDEHGDVFAANQISGSFLNASGNANVGGQYLKNNVCVAGCSAATAASSGRAVASYSAQATTPTIEDMGEGQLVAGQGYVALSSDFANVIDTRTNYLVFIPPEGDNRGLYVTNKTRAGFAVHESQGGRSSLLFSYRIVAKQYGVNRPRLPMVTIPALHMLHRPHRIAEISHP
jgi:hypothetical protein